MTPERLAQSAAPMKGWGGNSDVLKKWLRCLGMLQTDRLQRPAPSLDDSALVGVFGFEPNLTASKADQARLSAPHLLGPHLGIEPRPDWFGASPCFHLHNWGIVWSPITLLAQRYADHRTLGHCLEEGSGVEPHPRKQDRVFKARRRTNPPALPSMFGGRR